MHFINLSLQFKALQPSLQNRINHVLEHGRYIMGPEVGELEEKLARYVGVKHAIACANGTDALQIALMALDLQPGDEVIMPSFSYFATAEVCLLLRLVPVFVDIDPRTYNIAPSLIAAAITPRTKAIIPVSLFGQCADMDAINTIAKTHNLAVIEDGAQSFGASYKGRRSLALSTIGCTSFFPSKPLGCYGDGGMCFTNDEGLATRLRMIRVHGQSKTYAHDIIGVNSRLDTLQAAILLSKFEAFPQELELRQKVAARYTEHLKAHVETPYIEPHNVCAYAQYTIRTPHRDALQKALKDKDIPTMVYYPIPMPAQRSISNKPLAPQQFTHAEAACQQVLSLPMHPYLSEEEQDTVITAIKQFAL